MDDAANQRMIETAIQFITTYCRKNVCTIETAVEGLSGVIEESVLHRAIERIEEIARGVIHGPREGVLTVHGDSPQAPWYVGPADEDIYWPSLREHLEAGGWGNAALNALDASSTKVLANLSDPACENVNSRGLVLGYIQSGKTTNFTAVISKAADAGYRLFIVLSGVSNALRRQTQLRLTEQLMSLQPLHWTGLTDEFRDMGKPNQFGFAGLAQPGNRTLAVVKKNPVRLQNLINFLTQAHEHGALKNCPILVIDDEADQASLSPDLTEEKRTTINNKIVTLLSEFPKVSYVAYTATPFANFFVDPSYPENLYPRDFIISLPEPKGYFGPKRMFGRTDQDPPEIDVVRVIPEHEKALLAPPRGSKTAFVPSVTETVKSALRWFMLATTARRIMAGGKQPHSTMMIHTSERVAQHQLLWVVVAKEIERMRRSIAEGDQGEVRRFIELWEEECELVNSESFGIELPVLDEILTGLPDTFNDLGDLSSPDNESCGLIIDNGSASRRLLYDNNMPKPVIVIGGNTLARGLTLEGLVSSVFVRSVSLYDTLLQMGRWFGYRPGYESLPRIWMPLEVADRFEHLSRVEMEIREEIERYADTNVTPLEVAVKVADHPAMQITRASMMRAVRRIRLGYSGTEVDTAYLYNSGSWLQRNRRATERLGDACVKGGVIKSSTDALTIFGDVPVQAILEFFGGDDCYQVQPSAGSRFTEHGALQYIKSRMSSGELMRWNIAFVGTSDGRAVTICDGLTTTTVQRGRDSNRSKDLVVSIGDHLTASSHRAIDLPKDPDSNRSTRLWRDLQPERMPLLLVYVVDKDSKASTRGRRVDLGIVDDFYGIGIGFPTSEFPQDDGYVVVELPKATPDGEDDDFDATDLDNEGSADDIEGPL
jgi:hypothetical protein